ncbi:hypothetical protein K7X08_025685 [Anisodus acutangulus]|uniref:Phosphatidylinositol-glycan biosynthesis class X protein n=1 Tax=Anisodus acutangulus TaxID=402998 RepID=A0A9Q1R7F7_9SOLA|nr:hypothetical protein K7X08_025685 [Anisodus acutangulus]
MQNNTEGTSRKLRQEKFVQHLEEEISSLVQRRNKSGEANSTLENPCPSGCQLSSASIIISQLKRSSSPFQSPKSCEVIIVERLPSGVFADPFELQHLVQRGVFRDAAVFGDTNLELPSFLSNRSLVEPLGHGFSRVEFASPDLFLRCNVEGKHVTSCLFPLDKQNAKPNDGHPVWEVPCGNREHTEIVSAFTFISAVVSALLIIVASLR